MYQNVLDGNSGTWWFGSGWCCSNPSLPWGGGFNTYAGETIKFENVLDGDSWRSSTTHESTGTVKTDTFALCKLLHLFFFLLSCTCRLIGKTLAKRKGASREERKKGRERKEMPADEVY